MTTRCALTGAAVQAIAWVLAAMGHSTLLFEALVIAIQPNEEKYASHEEPMNSCLIGWVDLDLIKQNVLADSIWPTKSRVFCSMKITQDVRDYAATLNDPSGVGMSVSGTIEDGMAQMSAKFREMGESLYLNAEKVKESNRVF